MVMDWDFRILDRRIVNGRLTRYRAVAINTMTGPVGVSVVKLRISPPVVQIIDKPIAITMIFHKRQVIRLAVAAGSTINAMARIIPVS